MCIVFLTATPKYSLIMASNRDEFLARPTTRASFHDWSPSLSTHSSSPTPTNRVLSGLDLEAGGTWLGISFPPRNSTNTKEEEKDAGERIIRIATLTNFTETILPQNPPRPSRGQLVRDFLDYQDGQSVEEHLESLEKEKGDYAGFNLILAELRLSSEPTSTGKDPLTIGYCSNRETSTKKARVLPSFAPDSPVRGLSNATLEAEPGEPVWAKVQSGCDSVAKSVKELEASGKGEEELVQALWGTLSTPSLSPITHRSHLQHTVLVRPLAISPSSPLPSTPPPLPSATLSPSPSILPESVKEGKKEGEEGTRWYATRTQSVILVERDTGRIVMREREGYRLQDGKPVWVGDREPERVFEFKV